MVACKFVPSTLNSARTGLDKSDLRLFLLRANKISFYKSIAVFETNKCRFVQMLWHPTNLSQLYISGLSQQQVEFDLVCSTCVLNTKLGITEFQLRIIKKYFSEFQSYGIFIFISVPSFRRCLRAALIIILVLVYLFKIVFVSK